MQDIKIFKIVIAEHSITVRAPTQTLGSSLSVKLVLRIPDYQKCEVLRGNIDR